jgi:copper homeostasis protein
VPKILLEVCITSVEDAQAAQYGGADRLELNCALPLGGLTPTPALLAEVKKHTTLPVLAMLRPRSGGFCYSETEFTIMQHDAEALLANGADGLAFAVLTAKGEVDAARCRVLRELCGERVAVFQRAFDVVPQPFKTMEQLIELGFKRIMTSGQEVNTYNGAPLIAELIRKAAGRIEILPAGGINRFTVSDIVARTKCDQVHASLRTMHGDPSVLARPHVRFGTINISESQYDGTDLQAVRDMVSLLNLKE